MEQLDLATQELISARPRLVDELVVSPQEHRGRRSFHLELPSKSRFYRVGEAEYIFLSLLDGETTVGAAICETARVCGAESLTEREGLAVCRWLIERGMIRTDTVLSGDRVDLDEHSRVRRLLTGLNPLWIRKSLGNPDRVLNALKRLCGWVHSVPAMVVWLSVCVAAVVSAIGHRELYELAGRGLLAQSNWLWLALTWFLLKLLHELSHGLAAKRYGCRVPEAGLAFVLLIPMAYVDLSATYRLRSRRKRVHAAFAGMYVELFIAAVAALLFPWVSEESRAHLYNLIFTAGFTTLLFNANVLMRFDGYFMLADTLNIPNLYVDGQAWVSGVIKRIVLGEPMQDLSWRGWKGAIVRVYGVLAAVWRVVVSVSLIIAASTMFYGAGVVLAAMAVFISCSLGLLHLTKRRPADSVSRSRGWLVAGGLATVGAATLMFVPWPGHRTVPAIVQYEPLSILRAGSSGFVDQVLVNDGEVVEADRLLVRLRNEELEVERAELEFEMARSLAAERMSLQINEIAAARIQSRRQVSLDRQLQELETRLAALEIRAPHRGRVMARGLASRVGTYVETGDVVLSVGDEDRKEIHVSIGQPDIDAYRDALHRDVRVTLSGAVSFGGTLLRVAPRASLQPRHRPFCVPNGGPLSVVTNGTDDEDRPIFEYVTPRFAGRIIVPVDRGRELYCGQCGYAVLRTHDLCLGAGIYRLVSNWVRETTREAGL